MPRRRRTATRYFAYIELTDEGVLRSSNLWAEYEILAQDLGNFAMTRAASREQIYPVFRDLFSHQEAQ